MSFCYPYYVVHSLFSNHFLWCPKTCQPRYNEKFCMEWCRGDKYFQISRRWKLYELHTILQPSFLQPVGWLEIASQSRSLYHCQWKPEQKIVKGNQLVFKKGMKHIYLINLKKRKVFRFKRKGGQQNVQKRTYEVNIWIGSQPNE